MRRNFLFGLLLCLIPTAIASAFVALAFYRESQGEAGFRRGIDLAGGTILVYEVNTARRDTSPESEPELTTDDISKLAENLKRRIDPADLRNVIVRPLGASRVEIILPFTGSIGGGKEGANEEFVREVRALVSQAGVLEFRIVANPQDDREGIADAKRIIERTETDPKFKAELEDRARKGLPPPPPDREYTVQLNDTTQEGVTYEWVEMGREERESYGLSNAYANEAPAAKRGFQPQWLYPVLAQSRGKVVEWGNMLLYSRDHIETVKPRDEVDKKVEYFILTRVSPADSLKVAGDISVRASVGQRNLDPAVEFTFNAAGANQFGRITERNRKDQTFKRQLAIIMDDKIVSAPTLDAVIRDRGTISGSAFDLASVTRLVYILRSGALNAELKPDPVSENTVGPTLGQDTIRKGLLSVGLAFGAVLAFMVVYYRFAGVVACIALFINVLLTVGFMVAVNAAFTLPGLAGIVLMLGMAVDANVLIYERIREEREKGANLITAIRLGYDRAFATIIDTHLTSIFTCIVLYTFGNDNLKGFAVSLTLGLIISLFTALYVTRLIFDYFVYRRWLSQLRMMRLFARPNIGFMKIRFLMFSLTAFLTVAGLGLFLYRLTQEESILNVDFTKGTAYGGRLKENEARPLADADGRAGLLTLLGEKRQSDVLEVKDVVWLTRPTTGDEEGSTTTTREYIYRIDYTRGPSATVTFANPPDGTTEEAQLANVHERAQHLPGLSVEQVYLSGIDENLPSGTSRSFTVRTTEREPDLVQVSLDRLLRNEANEPILETSRILDTKISGSVAELTLDRPATPSYYKSFLTREMRLNGLVPSIGSASAVEVTGLSAADPVQADQEGRSGKYTRLRVDVSTNPELRGLKDNSDPKRTAQDTEAFQRVLDRARAAFETRSVPDRLETFDPALATDTRNKALYAILASWMAILAYLWFRFGSWQFGLAAVICLIHDLCLTLGVIAACHYFYDNPLGQFLLLHDFKIDLAAVAALLTLIGFSVNDTIVVFDRIREVRGKNPLLTEQMINDSINQTLSRTVLASLTVFLVVGVLYIFGGEGVHLFSFVMVVGVIVGTFSSIYVASPLLLLFGEGRKRTGDRIQVPAATAARPVESETVS